MFQEQINGVYNTQISAFVGTSQFGIQLTVHRINNMKHHYKNFIYSNIVITPLNFCVDMKHQCSSEKPFSSLNMHR